MPKDVAAQPGGGAPKQIVEWIVSALPAIAGGISFVGLVAILGAAITWVRFMAAQLPADQAISKIPKSDLAGIGAVSLVAFLILGLLAVLTVYMLQSRPFGDVADKVRDLEDDLASARARAASIERDLNALANAKGSEAPTGALEHERAHAYDEIAVLQGRILEHEGGTYGQRCPVPTLATQQGLVAVVAAEIVVAIFIADTPLGWKFLLAALVVIPAGATIAFRRSRTAGTGEQIRLRDDRAELAQVALMLVPFALIGALVDMVVVYAGAAAVLLGGAALVIARVQPRRFFWYGFAVFVSVALYGAVLEGIRTLRDPSVQALGVVMKDGRGISGLYVTETDDRLYLARVDTNAMHPKAKDAKAKDSTAPFHSDGRLFWLPRDAVRVYSVGPLQHVAKADARGPQLVQELQDGISPGASGAP